MPIIRTRDLPQPGSWKGNPATGPWPLPAGQKRFILDALKDGQWSGQRCFILGGGPSLKGFDFTRLEGERTIAVNRAFQFWPKADILFSMDYNFYSWLRQDRIEGGAREQFLNFAGLKIWADAGNLQYGPGIFYIRRVNRLGSSLYGWPANFNSGIFSGNNSGYGALQIAILLGARPIYLLGYDMKGANFHGGYPSKSPTTATGSFIFGFDKLAPEAARRGIEIFNCNPDSALRCFPFADIDRILVEGKKEDAQPIDEGPQAAIDEAGREYQPGAGADFYR